VWFLRVRFVILAPDSRREPSPPSGRKSTQPTVQILEASSPGPARSLLHSFPVLSQTSPIPHHDATLTRSAVIRTKPLAPHLSIKFLETAHTHIHTAIAPLSTRAPSAKVITMLVFEENARAAFAFGRPWLVLIKSHGGASVIGNNVKPDLRSKAANDLHIINKGLFSLVSLWRAPSFTIIHIPITLPLSHSLTLTLFHITLPVFPYLSQ
jgi:hypothetical protein